MNVPYCPEYNAIEKVWAIAKQHYRKHLTSIKIKRERVNMKQLILDSLESVKPVIIKKICRSTIEIIKAQTLR